MARIGGGWNAHHLARLELMADIGDGYTSAPRGNDLAADADVAGDMLHEGPLVGELRVWRDLAGELPQPWSLYQPLHVRLQEGEAFLRLTMARQWLGAGLRLRMAFPLGERARRVVADGPFGPVERAPGVARKARQGETEATPATAPMQRYVSVAGAKTGLTVFTDGLQEYEARPDGTLLITLERTFAEVSRRDLPERPGHASWPSRVHADAGARPPYRLAVLLHDPAELDRRDEIEEAADSFFASPVGFMRRALLARPQDVRGPELSGDGLVFSAMKPAESGKGIVLRCYNAREEAVSGRWQLPWPVRSAVRCRLDETPGERLTVDANGEIAFAAAAREVVTILLK
jgi:alpha-mannosidase